MEILNNMGQLETELTFEANKNNKETPFGMKTTPEFNTGIAWHNFDRFVETKSGKDTLHNAVGFAYQMRNIPVTNLTAMHSEKSTNCTNSLPLSQQLGIRQNQQLSQKNRDWLLLLMGQAKT